MGKKSPDQLAKKAAANRTYRDRRTQREKDAQKGAAMLAEKLRHVKQKPVGIPVDEQENREAWLTWAVEVLRPEFAARGYTVPQNIRVALGWPKGKALGCCFASDASSAGFTEIFISPLLSTPLEIFDQLTHELCHAAVGCQHGHRKQFATCADDMGLEGKPAQARGWENPDWRAWAEPLCSKLGPIPHDAMLTKAPEEKKQSTRMIKKECGACGFVVRTAQTWVEKALSHAEHLRCPDGACAGHLA